MTEFEKAVIAEVKRVRDLLNQAELANSFEFNIKANGRLSDGDVKIMFEIELDYDRIVAANSPAIEHKPEPKVDDEIPF